MFCPNCGTNNDAGTLFCENCGARLEQEQPVYQQPAQPVYQQPTYTQPQQEAYPYPVTPAPQKKSKLPLIIIAIVVAAAIAVGCYFAFSGSDKDEESDGSSNSISESTTKVNSSPENAAIIFIEGMVENDPDKALTAAYPEMEDLERELEEQCESIRTDAENNNVTFEDVSVSDVQDDAEEISDAEGYLLNSYNTEATIDEMKIVEVRVDRSSGEDSDYMTVDVYVAKIDGKWYVIRTD